ncbi:MAG: TetR/AcrR family transcriptional regulator [Tenacibaculum sp.]|nr:TetR/AcrR family transcriptional regulator [Tenacibaculum sp.]
MARAIDDQKLTAIKKSLIEIIIRDGATNASIAKVAKEAGVSSGYLYRHYNSKESLLLDLYVDKYDNINHILLSKIREYDTFKDVILSFYNEILKIAVQNENEILFLLKMMTDYSIKISDEMRTELKETIALILRKFKNEINSQIEGEQIFIQILGNIFLFINLRKRGVLKENIITPNDIKLLTQTTINALK